MQRDARFAFLQSAPMQRADRFPFCRSAPVQCGARFAFGRSAPMQRGVRPFQRNCEPVQRDARFLLERRSLGEPLRVLRGKLLGRRAFGFVAPQVFICFYKFLLLCISIRINQNTTIAQRMTEMQGNV